MVRSGVVHAGFRLGVLLLLVLTLATCGSNSTGTSLPVNVSVTPTTATVGAGGTQMFTATVANANNGGVTWSTSAGTITGTGNTVTFTAPVTGGAVTVRATSVEDASRSAAAAVTVTPVEVSVTPADETLFRGQSTAFTAAVTGTETTDVTWSATCGTVVGNGVTANYTAPNAGGDCDVTATSDLNPAISATVEVEVRSVLAVTSAGDADDGACTFADCSLREAINAANAAPDLDTILIVSTAANAGQSVVSRLFRSAQAITLTNPLPTIETDMVIVGEGSGTSTIDAGGLGRGLDVRGDVTVSVEGFTITNGAGNPEGAGGGVFVFLGAEFFGRDLVITGNQATEAGGGIAVAGQGTVAHFSNTVVESNETTTPITTRGGGGVAVETGASLYMMDSRIAGNQTEGLGGGLSVTNNNSMAELGNTVVEGNRTLGTSLPGGGIFFGEGTSLKVTNGRIADNEATDAGGGGIFGIGFVTTDIDGTVIENNEAKAFPGGGGGVLQAGGSVVLTGVTISHNAATLGSGGGILFSNQPEVTVGNSTIANNEAMSGGNGGGFAVQSGSTVSIDNSVFTGNGTALLPASRGEDAPPEAALLGSDEVVSEVGTEVYPMEDGMWGEEGDSPETPHAPWAQGYESSNDPVVSPARSRTRTAPSRKDGMSAVRSPKDQPTAVTAAIFGAGSRGGGISVFDSDAVITESEFLGNDAVVGGGVAMSASTVVLDRVRIADNFGQADGGGVFTGGGLTLTSSTVSNNNTSGDGGGIFAANGFGGAAPVSITNSTISGNDAGEGGGLLAFGPVSVLNSTVADNAASFEGGGIAADAGNIDLRNTILTMNRLGGGLENCSTSFAGTITSNGGNLADDLSCTTFLILGSDMNNTPSGLDPVLADNGGPTATHALLEGSAAIDAGISDGACPATDQRGFARVGDCDIGAFEFGAVAVGTSRETEPAASTRR